MNYMDLAVKKFMKDNNLEVGQKFIYKWTEPDYGGYNTVQRKETLHIIETANGMSIRSESGSLYDRMVLSGDGEVCKEPVRQKEKQIIADIYEFDGKYFLKCGERFFEVSEEMFNVLYRS